MVPVKRGLRPTGRGRLFESSGIPTLMIGLRRSTTSDLEQERHGWRVGESHQPDDVADYCELSGPTTPGPPSPVFDIAARSRVKVSLPIQEVASGFYVASVRGD